MTVVRAALVRGIGVILFPLSLCDACDSGCLPLLVLLGISDAPVSLFDRIGTTQYWHHHFLGDARIFLSDALRSCLLSRIGTS